MHFQPGRLKQILAKMADLEAIDPNLYRQGIIWSQNFVDRLETVYKSRKQDLPMRPELLGKETELLGKETPVSSTDNTQTKETKETKESMRERNYSAILAFAEILGFTTETLPTKEQVEYTLNHKSPNKLHRDRLEKLLAEYNRLESEVS